MKSEYRALIVEDERAAQMLTTRCLTREGFICQSASDGLQARELIKSTRYDVVITDLRMPNGHGHALAVSLLELKKRPLVVILTGVMEPAVAADLVKRGVDEVTFKPVDYAVFGPKVRALVESRRGCLLKDSTCSAL